MPDLPQDPSTSEADRLRELERQLHQLVEVIEEVFFIVDPVHGRTLYISPSYATVWGRSLESAYADARAWLEAIHPEDRPAVEAMYARAAAGAQIFRIVRPDGGVRWVRSKSTVVKDGAGAVRVLGVAEDITELKQVEEALRLANRTLEEQVAVRSAELSLSEERYRKLVERSPVPIAVHVKGDLVYVNPAGLAMLGATRPEELLGRSILSMVPKEFHDRMKTEERLLLAEGRETAVKEMLLQRVDGPVITVEIMGIPILFDGREATYMVVQDVTARKKAEAALREREAQLRQAQKMEAVGQLAGGIAHDFNNLLTVILGNGQLLMSRLAEGDPARQEAKEIEEAGQRAADLTRQLLAFSRRQPVAVQSLDVNRAVRRLEPMLQRLIGDDIVLESRLTPEASLVKADEGQLDQVLINLVVNAKDAMPGGGRILMETSMVELDQAYADHHVEVRPGRYLLLAVSDTGHGMSAEVVRRIFEPFFTTKEVGRGTGLGLSIVYGIVKQSNGHIGVYSEPGKGATFKVYLPPAEALKVPEAGAPGAAPVERGAETILLVEDQAPVRRLAKRVLERQGYQVVEAGGAQEALLRAREHRGPLHLVVSDVVMAEMNGVALVERLLAARPEMRALFMSGYTEHATGTHTALPQGAAFLPKPFTLEGLAAKVREVLDRPRQPTRWGE